MELWELTVRERIRDTLALYNWSGDAFRLGELAAVFVPVGDEWLIRHRFVSTDWRDPASTMAAPSSVA